MKCYKVLLLLMLLSAAIGEGIRAPGLRRHPSRHLKTEALRLEIRLATAMGRGEEGQWAQKRIHYCILSSRQHKPTQVGKGRRGMGGSAAQPCRTQGRRIATVQSPCRKQGREDYENLAISKGSHAFSVTSPAASKGNLHVHVENPAASKGQLP